MDVSYLDLRILSEFYHLDDQATRRVALEVDPDDKHSVQVAIRRYVLPRIREAADRRDPEIFDRLRESLRYFLTTRDFPAEDVFYAHEPCFDHPRDPIDYYRWAWEVLFGDEPYTLASLDGYVERDRGQRP